MYVQVTDLSISEQGERIIGDERKKVIKEKEGSTTRNKWEMNSIESIGKDSKWENWKKLSISGGKPMSIYWSKAGAHLDGILSPSNTRVASTHVSNSFLPRYKTGFSRRVGIRLSIAGHRNSVSPSRNVEFISVFTLYTLTVISRDVKTRHA